MWWFVGILAAAAALLLIGLIRWRIRARRWRKHVQRLARQVAERPPAQPACPEAHFLHGCWTLQQGDPPQAVHDFQRAYHRCPSYELAALLVFTCMKMSRQDMPNLLRFLVETWAGMRRADLPSCRREQLFLQLIRPPGDPPPPAANEIARIFWALPVPVLRQQISAALREQPPWACDLQNNSTETTRPSASGTATKAALS